MIWTLFMASKHRSTESLPRIWAIEALACSKQLKASELIELIRSTPELSGDIGKNARELVSLRILESLFVEGNQNDTEDAYALCQKIEFDPSNSCEDVLSHIFQEMSTSKIKLGASEMLKWDVKSFIAHKRDSLPVFALQKLKDAVLEGSHSVFASLKVRSGVMVRTECDNNISCNGVNPNTPVQRSDERSEDTQMVFPNQNSGPNTTENGVEELQETLPDRNSLLCKRNRTDISNGNLEREGQIMQDNHYDPYAECAKKFKQDFLITENTAVEKLKYSDRNGLLANSFNRIVEDIDREVCSFEDEAKIVAMEKEHTGSPHDACKLDAAEKFKQVVNITERDTVVKSITSSGDEQLVNSSERSIEHIDSKGRNLEKEAEIGCMDIKHTGSTYDCSSQCAALEKLAGRCDVVDAGDWNCQQQNPSSDNMELNMPGELQGKSNYADKANGHMEGFEEKALDGISLDANEDYNNENEALNSSHHNLQENASTGCEANDVTEHNQVLERGIDSRNYCDERNDIASKKKTFLSSQCTYSQDSLATQPNFCMKCNRGGQLLICSSSTCPLVVHGSCLGTAAKFDGNGKFYCPFCAYSRAISDYSEAKRKASIARKDLATFIGLKGGHQPELLIRSHRSMQNEVCRVDELCENNEANIHRDPLDEVARPHMRPNEEDKLQAEPSVSCAGNNLTRGETVADSAHGEPKTLENGNLQEESSLQPGEQPIEVEAPRKSDCVISSHNQAHIVHKNERQSVTRGWKKVKHPPESSLPSEPPSQTSRESAEEDDGKVCGIDELCENNEANIHRDPLDEVVRTHMRSNEEDKLQAETSVSCASNGLTRGKTVSALTHGEPNTLEDGNLQEESPLQPGEQPIEVEAPRKSDCDISSHKQADIARKNERQTVTRGWKKVEHPPESSLPSEPPSRTSCESTEEDDDNSSALKYSMRSKKPEVQYTYPAIPLLRRKRHPWTRVEEEKLKEGVEKFSSPEDLSIPWKTILEFGADVFEKGRTTVDLKDKWRNMNKAGRKSK